MRKRACTRRMRQLYVPMHVCQAASSGLNHHAVQVCSPKCNIRAQHHAIVGCYSASHSQRARAVAIYRDAGRDLHSVVLCTGHVDASVRQPAKLGITLGNRRGGPCCAGRNCDLFQSSDGAAATQRDLDQDTVRIDRGGARKVKTELRAT